MNPFMIDAALITMAWMWEAWALAWYSDLKRGCHDPATGCW